ncbi:MAG: hypothetical protein G01um10147_790 [Microgenomates group bacterium Gr01-1014_7]|nr:MAG: hypothetical protein G01um10147_790 [Microgenomates group bacterium Gr01-1014_7]
MDKKEFDVKLAEAGQLVSSLIIGYLVIKFADNKISSKLLQDLILQGGYGQLITSNVIGTSEKVLAQIEEKVLMLGSGVGTPPTGGRVVAGFVDSDNSGEANLAKPEIEQPKEKTFCASCGFIANEKPLCIQCGAKRL